MRYFYKVNVIGVKELTMGLINFNPVIPEGIGVLFYIHLFLVSTLFAYFPFSKLTHMAGVFLSPTRNLANTNRARRHVNPWNYPVKVHTYQEREEEFHDKIEAAGLPRGWQRIILDGMKERLEKYRSFRLFMDICVRCGACADKCHFYIGSGDPKNMPVLRGELLRSVYRRYFTES